MADPTWLHYLETCPSTNSWAIAHLANLQHGDVVFTPQQTAGRGQQGRVWRSPPGVLTMSIVLRDLSIDCLGYFSLWAGVAVVEAIRHWVPEIEHLGLKWPNDVWWHDRKLAGLLAETSVAAGSVNANVILGLGLNYQVDFSQVPDAMNWGWPEQIVSLVECSKHLPEVISAIEHLRANFLQIAYLNRQPSDINQAVMITKVNHLDVMRDRLITVEMGDGLRPTGGHRQFTGVGAGINAVGEYQLRLASGELMNVRSGRLRRKAIG
jgi:BirA family transcriptional regulator, biotin operon repressor / biotin---[acetyl-CoA-carboxylase] ligase